MRTLWVTSAWLSVSTAVLAQKAPGKGGSINGAGPAIANGMVFTNSGQGTLGQAEGNVLLAFSLDGK
jgi:hypothetical protein